MGHVKPLKGTYKICGNLGPERPDRTARDIATEPLFQKLCKYFKVTPTIRQARKYRAKEGKFSSIPKDFVQ